MSDPEPNVVSLSGNDLDSTLLKIRLFRQRGEMDEARLLLEQALAARPENEEIKALLLQTEKDQLALKREKKKGSDGAGLTGSPWQLVAIGVLGIVCAAGIILGFILPKIIFMIRFGFTAPVAQYSRGNYDNPYYVPANYTLIMPLFGLVFFVGLVIYAVRSYRT